MTATVEQSLKNNPNTTIQMPELLSEISALKTDDEKKALVNLFIESNDRNKQFLMDFIQSVYHPDVVLDLPTGGIPPYKDNDYLDYDYAPIALIKALKRVHYFVKGVPNYISNRIKREQLFIQTLEGMYKDDVGLFVAILNKKLDTKKYPGVSDKLFWEMFPEWFPEDYQPSSVTHTVKK